jgi:hypothetical protein
MLYWFNRLTKPSQTTTIDVSLQDGQTHGDDVSINSHSIDYHENVYYNNAMLISNASKISTPNPHHLSEENLAIVSTTDFDQNNHIEPMTSTLLSDAVTEYCLSIICLDNQAQTDMRFVKDCPLQHR